MEASPPPKRKTYRLTGWVVAAVAVFTLGLGAAVVGAVAFSNAGTSLARKDFTTDASAAAFVAAHLPAPLAGSVVVRKLTYERFTDWHLDALLDLDDANSANAYLERARAARQQNVEYCGGADDSGTVSYFLPKFFACGSIQRGSRASELRIECYTR